MYDFYRFINESGLNLLADSSRGIRETDSRSTSQAPGYSVLVWGTYEPAGGHWPVAPDGGARRSARAEGLEPKGRSRQRRARDHD